MGLLGPFIGRLFDKVGPLPLTVTGSSLMVLALWQFSLLDAGTPVGWIIALHVGLSLGLALIFTPAFTTGLNPLPPHLYSHGSAIMSTLQQVAGAAGTALLVSIYAVVSARLGTGRGNARRVPDGIGHRRRRRRAVRPDAQDRRSGTPRGGTRRAH